MTRPTGPARHAGGMNIYLINALLVLLVVRQIREHQLDARALAVPVLAVAAAAVMFLHAVPAGGGDITLDLLCAARESWRRACGSPASGPGWPSTSPPPTAPARPSPPSASRTTSPAPPPGPPRWS